jgi:hypothetical protein
MTKPHENANQEPSVLVEGLRSFGGVAALILGSIYIAGILVKTVDLADAGISPRDALPLYPLELILRTGLTLVAPVLGLVALFGSIMAVAGLYERRLEQIADSFKQSELDRVPDTQWLQKYEKAVKEADWDPVNARLNIALQAAKRDGDRDRVKLLRRQRLAFGGFSIVAVLAGAVIGAIALLTLPVPLIIAFTVMWAGFMVAPFGPSNDVVKVLGVFYALLAAMLVVYLLAYPRPLSIARISTDNEGVVSGRLIVMSDSNWYVGSDSVIRALSQDHAKCVVIEPQTTKRNTLLRLFLERDADAPRPQLLKCR